MPKKPTLRLPKVSFSAIGQILFVLKEIFVIAWSVNPRLVSAVIILNTVWGLTNLPLLYFGKLVIDIVIHGIVSTDKIGAVRMVAIILTLTAAVSFVRQVISRVLRMYQSNLSRRCSAKVEVLLGEKVSGLDIPTLEDSAFKDRYNKVERESSQRVWNLIMPVSDLPGAFFSILSSLVLIFTFNPLIVLVVIALSLPEIMVNARSIKAEYEFETSRSSRYRLWGWTSYYLGRTRNYFEPRILGNAKYLINRLVRLQDEIMSARELIRNKRTRLRSLVDIPNTIFLLLFNIWLFAIALFGRITLGTAQMLYNASTSFQSAFENLIGDLLQIYENYLYMVDLSWVLHLSLRKADGKTVPKRPFTKGVELQGVWFRYPKAKSWILKDVSVEIRPRENIAIVGENGAGKTTLIKLLCGFYQPQKGRILVNGVDISKYKRQAYWKILSVLFQNFEEYPFTARESIGYGDVDRISKTKEVVGAAVQSGIHEFITGLPLKYENPLSKEFEGGIEPSKGQWQRIALARTLFKNGEIVILDEPTSNVDPKAEEEIFDKVIDLTRKKILILISHRFSTVRRADRIFVIDGGRIVEDGSHDDLLAKKGLYAELFKLQAKGYQ
ncbi:MAG: ABC transporter ATP-binding protein/permease [Deltaproteobacteria bacterium]|nr:ABC transporter ATP-binding protein/permease [Deltaproteobacteria bacterium]